MRQAKLLSASVLLVGVALLGWAANRGLTQGLDLQLADWLALRRGISPDWLIGVMQAISWTGGGPQRTLIVVLIAAALWRWRGGASGLAMALTSLTSNWASNLLKLYFARPRPHLVPHLDDVGTSLSYPSGHATSAAVVYLLLAMVLPPQRRTLWLALAATLALLTGLSRMMLGVHFASDIVGGWMLGAAFASVGAEAVQRWTNAKP